MDTSKPQLTTIDQYIEMFPKEVQDILQTVREVIREEVPDAVETISYAIPTFKLNGKNLVHFAGMKNYLGFYPTPSPIVAFKKELSQYKTSKGAIQFPFNEPIPLPLIRKIVAFRVKENAKNK